MIYSSLLVIIHHYPLFTISHCEASLTMAEACFTECSQREWRPEQPYSEIFFVERVCAMGQLLNGFLEEGTTLASDLGLAKVPWLDRVSLSRPC